MAGAEFGPGRDEGLKRGDVDLWRDLHELDVAGPKARLRQRGLRVAQERRIVHQGIAGTVVRDGDETQPDGVVAGARGDADHLRRRQRQHGEMGQRNLPRHHRPPRAGAASASS